MLTVGSSADVWDRAYAHTFAHLIRTVDLGWADEANLALNEIGIVDLGSCSRRGVPVR